MFTEQDNSSQMLQDSSPRAIFEVQTDAEGNWNLGIPKDLGPGIHRVTVVDEQGMEKDTALFTLEKDVQVIEKIREGLTPAFFYGIIFFLLIILLLAANTLRLMRKAKKRETKNEAMIKQRTTAAIMVIAIVASFIVGGLILFFTGSFNLSTQSESGAVQTSSQEKLEKTAIIHERINGVVLNPYTLLPEAGLRLKMNEVSIDVGEAGRFVFTKVKESEPLTIEHEALKGHELSLYLTPDANSNVFIYFDKKLYGLIVDIFEAEQSQTISQIYNSAANGLQEEMDKLGFVEHYESLYDDKDGDDFSLKIKSMKFVDNYVSSYEISYPRVLQVEFEHENRLNVYSFTYENDAWKLVE
ncbi:MAG: hypothetical protein ACOYUZ_04040 [Patescibacteria group bacterium]